MIRAYRTVNGEKIYGAYSPVRSVQVRGMCQLERDVEYTQFDIDSDGAPDDFFYYYDSSSGDAWFYVNGFSKGSAFMGRGGYVYVCCFGPGEVYYITWYGLYGGNGVAAYRCENGQFVVVNDSGYFEDRILESSDIWKVVDQELYIKSAVYRAGNWETFAQAETAPVINTKFKARDGKFVLSTREYWVVEEKTYRALNSFSTSTSRTSWNTKGPRVNKGQKVTVQKVYLPANGGTAQFMINVNGKTGWIKDSGSCRLG